MASAHHLLIFTGSRKVRRETDAALNSDACMPRAPDPPLAALEDGLDSAPPRGKLSAEHLTR